jgi:hypothetical protein
MFSLCFEVYLVTLLTVERCVLAKFKYWYITNMRHYVYLRTYLLCSGSFGQKGAVQVVVMRNNMAAHVQKPEVYTGGGDIDVFLP